MNKGKMDTAKSIMKRAVLRDYKRKIKSIKKKHKEFIKSEYNKLFKDDPLAANILLFSLEYCERQNIPQHEFDFEKFAAENADKATEVLRAALGDPRKYAWGKKIYPADP